MSNWIEPLSPKSCTLRLALVFLCATALSCRPPAADHSGPRHVFLITVDTLRADHLSLYGYPRITSPRIDAMAADGVTFEQAICQWPKTGTSFASIFTGRYPQTLGITHKAAVRVPETYRILPQLFQDEGFTTLGVVSNAVLASRFGWDRGFDEFRESWGSGDIPQDPHAFRPLLDAARVNALALPMLRDHGAADRLFVWLHYSDPHAPYVLPAGNENPFLGDAYDVGDGQVDLAEVRGRNIGEHTDLRYYVAQYDANIRVVDRAIQQVLDLLEELELRDDSLIVFTADHGESLGEHGSYFEHGPFPYSPTARVPLVVVPPEGSRQAVAGRRVAEPVELVDLFPTLLDLVFPDMQVEGLEGRSLAGMVDGDTEPDADYAFTAAGRTPHRNHYRSIQDERWKLVYHPAVLRRNGQPRSGERWELYELPDDPLESHNLLAEEGGTEAHVEVVRRLRRELFSWMGEDGRVLRPGQDEDMDEATLEALRALGYVQ